MPSERVANTLSALWRNHLRTDLVVSKCLENSSLGTATSRCLYTLLPCGGLKSGQSYPQIWFLDGYLGNGISMLDDPGPLGKSFGQNLWEWQQEGLLPPCICFFPDPSTPWGGSQFLNSSSNGNFLDHFTDELIPFAENLYPCKTGPENRLVTGHSSGGYGSLAVPLLRPGVFGLSISSALDSAFECSLQPLFASAASTFSQAGGPFSFLQKHFQSPDPSRLGSKSFEALLILAMASCYSPNPNSKDLFCDLPFDLETLEETPAWSLWIQNSPEKLLQAHSSALRQLKYLHLDVGSSDEFAAQFGHRRISRQLKSMGIDHINTEFQGGHSGTKHRYQDRFKRIGPTLKSLGWY